MIIENLRIEELVPYEKNAKLHPKEQIQQIISSIKQFGNNDPIAIGENNVIIEGHGRLIALKEMGYKEVPVIRLGHLNEEQRKAYTLVHNKLTMNTDFDLNVLEEELSDIENIDMTEFDFDTSELEEEKDVEEDEFNGELPEEPVSKQGDVYQLGRHRLMCGDSTSEKDVSVLMNGKKADMVFTDPPYGVSYKNNMNDKFGVIKNDDVFIDVLPILKTFSKDNIHWYIWTAHQVYPVWRAMYEEHYKNTIIWSKGGGGMGDLEGNYATDYEMCLFCHYGRKELNGTREGAVWELNKDSGSSYIHPTQKPLSLASKAMEKSSLKNDLVLDLFGGSGSTLIACEQKKRSCAMMELDPKYIDVIINRWEEYTGEKAVLLQEV